MANATRTALVTGATSGIGQWIALGLAQAGFRVLATAREAGRAEALRRFMTSEAGAGVEVEVLLADLAALAEVRRLAAEVRQRAPALHVLINNAGLMTRRRELTVNGIERTLAVNHVAPFLLTQELLAPLRAAAAGGAPGSARIVNVGSASSDAARIAINDLQLARGWTPYRAYSQSKLALMITTFELARRLSGSGITANVVHPGLVATRIAEIGGIIGFGWVLTRPFMLKPRQGADTPLYVATEAALDGQTGLYFKRRAPAPPNPLAQDTALAARLWEATERLVV
jgi:NAD(P)-dependent dehydrogenase (short-subunit alcohol dehydrogenase family)